MSLEEVLQRSKIKCVLWRKEYFIDEDGSWSLFSVSLPSFHIDSDHSLKDLYRPVQRNGFYGHSLDLCTSFLIIVLYPDNLQQATKPVCQRHKRWPTTCRDISARSSFWSKANVAWTFHTSSKGERRSKSPE